LRIGRKSGRPPFLIEMTDGRLTIIIYVLVSRHFRRKDASPRRVFTHALCPPCNLLRIMGKPELLVAAYDNMG
jgi:hypothetical protein